MGKGEISRVRYLNPSSAEIRVTRGGGETSRVRYLYPSSDKRLYCSGGETSRVRYLNPSPDKRGTGTADATILRLPKYGMSP